MAVKRYVIKVNGIVQGVGYRPFVYNLAHSLGITGFVLNDSEGVTIEAEGNEPILKLFVIKLKEEAPPLARINDLSFRREKVQGFKDFSIRESRKSIRKTGLISPDIAVCSDCLKEMMDAKDRRYLYPFINCTNCGPRFTITLNIPYDRINTTMKSFAMCDDCRKEYENPLDRRFHAQPVACSKCGPELMLLNTGGGVVKTGDVIKYAKDLLKDGKILAVKGLGGYHLSCDALNAFAVKELRHRKKRDERPFALMLDSVDTVREYCIVNNEEERLLNGTVKPIVLLKVKPGALKTLSMLSPDNNLLGVMLPYTPLHSLLFGDGIRALVMTSGNISGEPICYKDQEALNRLESVADFFLIHNREIHMRTDDSVTSTFKGVEYIIRRSRGYVPYPVNAQRVLKEYGGVSSGVLAVGGELKNTFCMTKNSMAFLSHYIGDLENLETLRSFEDGIEHYKGILDINPRIIAYDLHPDYLSGKYALDKEDMKKIPVQHHKAHIASCMAENGLTGDVIGVSFDGTGYGEDGNIWGGEFFSGDYRGFVREAHIDYIDLPGGNTAVKEPWRIALGLVLKYFDDSSGAAGIDFFGNIDPDKIEIVKHQINVGINTFSTSSAGRLFDGVSSLLGVCRSIKYEGQAAILLEKLCDAKTNDVYSYCLKGNEDTVTISPEGLIKGVINDILKGETLNLISSKFHNTVSAFSIDTCEMIREKRGLDRVVLSGGVFQNRELLGRLYEGLHNKGFKVYLHSAVPANDGGISLGQAIIGSIIGS